jgi:lipid A disaccharide synthetase
MTGEEMERAIDFLLKSQANLEARIEEVDQRLGARIEEVNRNLSAQMEASRKLFDEYQRMQTMLVQVVTRTFAEQADFNRRTDEKLNALIDTVNRMLGGGQGGNP